MFLKSANFPSWRRSRFMSGRHAPKVTQHQRAASLKTGVAVRTAPVDVNAQSLLLSPRVRRIRYEPFCLFWLDDFLPADAYAALASSFPDDSYFAGESEGGKRYFSSRRARSLFLQFRQQHPLWNQLLCAFESDAFVRDLNRMARRALVEARGLSGLKAWRLDAEVPAGWQARFTQPAQVEFQFSRLGVGSYVLPHTDSGAKLASLMLYFPSADWQEAYGGGTEFYRPKRTILEENWANAEFPFEEMATFATTGFCPNRLAVFLKSKNSFHGVPPVRCPRHMTRDSLNINVLVRKPKRSG